MNIRLKCLEVKFTHYEHGIPESDWVFAPIHDTSKTIRELVDEAIEDVRERENENEEFDQAYCFTYEAMGREYDIDYDEDTPGWCRLSCGSERKHLMESNQGTRVFDIALEKVCEVHKQLIELHSPDNEMLGAN